MTCEERNAVSFTEIYEILTSKNLEVLVADVAVWPPLRYRNKSFSQRFFHLQCEWLLGDRKPSPEDLDKGIDTNSPLFQAILENPVVQLGLTNPKTLLGTVQRLTPRHLF